PLPTQRLAGPGLLQWGLPSYPSSGSCGGSDLCGACFTSWRSLGLLGKQPLESGDAVRHASHSLRPRRYTTHPTGSTPAPAGGRLRDSPDRFSVSVSAYAEVVAPPRGAARALATWGTISGIVSQAIRRRVPVTSQNLQCLRTISITISTAHMILLWTLEDTPMVQDYPVLFIVNEC